MGRYGKTILSLLALLAAALPLRGEFVLNQEIVDAEAEKIVARIKEAGGEAVMQ